MNGAIRDTILIPGGCFAELTICFDALNPGTWVLLSQYDFNEAAGMITTVEYT